MAVHPHLTTEPGPGTHYFRPYLVAWRQAPLRPNPSPERSTFSGQVDHERSESCSFRMGSDDSRFRRQVQRSQVGGASTERPLRRRVFNCSPLRHLLLLSEEEAKTYCTGDYIRMKRK